MAYLGEPIDRREAILVELLAIANSTQSVMAAARNVTDAAGLSRPAVVINDGPEEVLTQPDSAIATLTAIMEMMPEVEIRVGGAPSQVGTISNLILARIRYRVLTSTTIRSIIGSNGKIFIRGASLIGPKPGSQESRMDTGFSFQYHFRAEDLADL